MNIERALSVCTFKILDYFKIKKSRGKANCVVVFGHWKQPGRIWNKLFFHMKEKHGIECLEVDESWTSKCHHSHSHFNGITGICEEVYLKKTIGIRRTKTRKSNTYQKQYSKFAGTTEENKRKWSDKYGNPKDVKVWRLVQCNLCKDRHQRDQNACINIHKIGMDLLKYKFRLFPRFISKKDISASV